jgi:SPP1 family predicted phage head-tail adaptor
MANPPPSAGDLRHRLTYQTRSTVLDPMNEAGDVWTSVGTFWARVEPLTGMELMNARQLKATTGHKVLMRNVGGIVPSGRFLFEATGRVFGIDQVFRIDEQNAFLSIHCSELINPQ